MYSFPLRVTVTIFVCIPVVCFVPLYSSSHQLIPISLFCFLTVFAYFSSTFLPHHTQNSSRLIFSISPYLFLAFACGLSTFCLLFLFIASCKKLKHKYWFENKAEDCFTRYNCDQHVSFTFQTYMPNLT